MKLKIAFFETEPWEKQALISGLKDFDLFFYEEKINPENLKDVKDIDILSCFIYSKIDDKTLSHLKSLKYIVTRSTGFDHINLDACKKRNILVSNIPAYGENTVAEHTFALILALSRNIYPSIQRTKKGDFSLQGLKGFELKGKTIGIVGTGSIGKHVARMAKGFEMNILAYDVNKDQKFAKKLDIKYVSLENLFKNSDIVTLHVPYIKQTHHLINLKNLKLFKKGCYLINTARGEICDTKALLEGLKKQIFAGLGLDVLEKEIFIKEEKELLASYDKRLKDLKIAFKNRALINQPNVIITPHNAFNSKESLNKIIDTTIENIKGFSKQKPINLISK